jgi:hypothetical protein
VEFFVHKTLDGLKKRLVNNKLLVQGDEGFVVEMEFQFNDPASEEEIQEFIQSTGVQLPQDYQAFLRIHNGAILFQPWYGGQMELFPVSKIIKEKVSIGIFLESWFPIGCQDGGFLMIDGDNANRGDQDYLLWWESSRYEDVEHLNLNFELWLDRFIISQGAKFWHWPRYNVHNYYKLR